MPAALPIIMAVSAVAGVGLGAYGAIQQSKAAKSQDQYSRQMALDQQRQEALRRQAMELENRRRQTEAVRNQQRARSMALAAANNQGATFGSGLQGGYGQISGETGTQLLGLSQNLALGRANFDLSADITQARYGYASASSAYNTGQGIQSLGGSIVSSLGEIGRLSGGFFPGSSSYSTGSSPYMPFGSGSAGAIY